MGTIQRDASNQLEENPRLEEIISNQLEENPRLEEIIYEDGILWSILSKLPMREAVRASVLSPRWRYIWTHLPNLIFDAPNMFDAVTVRDLGPNSPLTLVERAQLLTAKTDEFIQSVNSVLQQHQGRATIDRFTVFYTLHKIHSDHLDSWIRFAVASKTEKLTIVLLPPLLNFPIEPYAFPFQLLGSSSIEVLSLAVCSLKPPCQFDGLNHLKILVLLHVFANEEDINRLVSNCPVLEKLVVRGSRELTTLSIAHPLSHLLFLDLTNFDQLRNIEMSAVNLCTLTFQGVAADFKLRQSSKLRVADICFETDGSLHNLDWYLSKLASNLPRLKFLKFNISGVLPEVTDLPKISNAFIHLKFFDWTWNINGKMSPLHLATLLDVAPFLEALKLQFLVRAAEQPLPGESREMLPKRPTIRLKNISISGFYFDQWQIQAALYLLNNATQLESMTIEKGREPYVEINEADIMTLRQEARANIKLVIL